MTHFTPSRFGRRFVALSALLVLASAAVGQATSPFMRLQKPAATIEVLQTKARRYSPANGNGPTVWLVGVAHIGQADYYKEIQKLLDQQSVVFYEGVSRNGVDPAAPKTAPKTDPKDDPRQKSMYQVLSDTLGLQFQLFGIDYNRPTFRNSDLSWEEMTALEAKAPATTGGGPNLSAIGNMLNADSPQGKMLGMFLASIKDDPSSIEAMRLVMVETLSTPGAIDKAMSPELSNLIIKTRNAKVLGDLKTEVAKQPAPKSIAIFFGAGHMGDLEQHLTADLGYKAGEERWFSAIKGDTSKVKEGNGKMLLDMMRDQFKGKGGG